MTQERPSMAAASRASGYRSPGERECCGNCTFSKCEASGRNRCHRDRPVFNISKAGICNFYWRKKS